MEISMPFYRDLTPAPRSRVWDQRVRQDSEEIFTRRYARLRRNGGSLCPRRAFFPEEDLHTVHWSASSVVGGGALLNRGRQLRIAVFPRRSTI